MNRYGKDETQNHRVVPPRLLLLMIISSGQSVGHARGFEDPIRGNPPALPESCQGQAPDSSEATQLRRTLSGRASAAGLNELGELYLKQGKRVCAIATFQAALGLDTNLWGARLNLGSALAEEGNPQRAVEELRVTVRARPDSFVAH